MDVAEYIVDIWLLYDESAQLMPLPLTDSCSSKSRLVLPFWCQLTWVVPDKIQEGRKTVVCVCVCVCVCLECFDAVGWVAGRASGL